MEEIQNYYDILEVTPDATEKEIKKAYLRTKNAYSQDSIAIYSLMDAGETERVLEKIEEAYHVLSTPEKRRKYDQAKGFLNPEEKDVFEDPLASEEPEDSVIQEDSLFPGHESVTGIAELAGMGESPSVFDEPVEEPEKVLEEQEHEDGEDLEAKSGNAENISRRKPATAASGQLKRFQIEKYYEKNQQMEDLILSEEEFRGPFFQKVRSYKKLSLQDLGEITKISRNYLQAIEEEDYPNLPATVYIRGFVSQYAKTLKLPAERAADAYIKRVREARGQIPLEDEDGVPHPTAAEKKKKSWWPFW